MQTVYRNHIPGDWMLDPMDVLYIAKGDVTSRCTSHREAMNEIEQLREESICYDGDLNALSREQGEVYRYVYPGNISRETRVTEWYPTREGASTRAVELGFDMNESYLAHADLAEQRSFPRATPFEVSLYSNDRGLYCKIDMRPDETGGFREKFYFPDKSCRDKLVPGTAIVTSVIDHGNYGFIVAAMKQYTRPDEQALAELLVGNDNYWNNTTIEMLDTPYGKLTRISHIVKNRHTQRVETQDCWIAIQDKDGIQYDYYLEHLVMNEIDKSLVTIEETISAADFLCQGYQGCTLDEFGKKFTLVPFDLSSTRYRTVKYRTDLYDEAMKCGVFKSYKFDDIDYVEIDDTYLLRFAVDFNQEEVEKLISMVNRINESATNTIQKRIKSGKYRLSLR